MARRETQVLWDPRVSCSNEAAPLPSLIACTYCHGAAYCHLSQFTTAKTSESKIFDTMTLRSQVRQDTVMKHDSCCMSTPNVAMCDVCNNKSQLAACSTLVLNVFYRSSRPR